MTLTELRYVVAVAREGHFGRAAEACFVSQPTLSVAVRKLEEELQTTLFERGTQEVRVTPAGEPIITQAERVLEEAAAIKELARQGRDPLVGPLKLGVIFTVGPYLLPHLIPLLSACAPRMPLVIEEGFTETLAKRLKAGDLDLIIVALPFHAPGIKTEALYEERFIVLLPSAHPWTQRGPIPPADLVNENLLLLGRGHCFREQVLEICPGCRTSAGGDSEHQMVLESSSLETIRHMVASGMGITVLPCTAAGADRYSQRLLSIHRFTEPEPFRTVALAWRRSFPRPQAVAAVRQAVLQCQLTCLRLLPGPA